MEGRVHNRSIQTVHKGFIAATDNLEMASYNWETKQPNSTLQRQPRVELTKCQPNQKLGKVSQGRSLWQKPAPTCCVSLAVKGTLPLLLDLNLAAKVEGQLPELHNLPHSVQQTMFEVALGALVYAQRCSRAQHSGPPPEPKRAWTSFRSTPFSPSASPSGDAFSVRLP